MKNLSLLFLVLFFVLSAAGQTMYESKLSESKMVISGTSTLHDWESKVEDFTAKCIMEGDEVNSVSFTAKVKSIKSGTDSMDDNTYEAMNASEYPTIIFESGSIKSSGSTLSVSGTLTIAGESNPIKMDLTIEKWSEHSVRVSGSYSMKMSDYGIKPPRAMFGTIKTGDKVTVKFEIVLYK